MIVDGRTVGVVLQLLILSILGVVGNAFVIAVYVRQKHNHSAVIFILTLAVTDFITCLITIPFTIASELVHYQLRYDFVCKLYHFLITSTVPFSAFIMTVIAFDRFLNIVGPLRFRCNVVCSRITVICLAALAAASGVITSLMYGVQSENDISYYDGQCLGVNEHLPYEAGRIWQKVYSSFYLICGVVVIILYAIIYIYVITNHNIRTFFGRNHSHHTRNETELRSINVSYQNATDQTPVIGVDDGVAIDGGNQNAGISTSAAPGRNNTRISKRRHIQLGFMLSVVAFVYLLCFLPAWLMSHGVIQFNVYVFYFYFSYHVTNPIVYSLISRSFRRKLAVRLGYRSTNADDQYISTSESFSTAAN